MPRGKPCRFAVHHVQSVAFSVATEEQFNVKQTNKQTKINTLNIVNWLKK